MAAAMSHSRSGSWGMTLTTGVDGIQDPDSSTATSITRVWVATSALGAATRRISAAARPPASSTPSAIDDWALPDVLGEADRVLAPTAATQVDDSARDQPTVGVGLGALAHVPGEAVVLVAEAGDHLGLVAHLAALLQPRHRHASGACDEAGPVGPTRLADLQHRHADVDRGGEQS